MCFKRYLGWAWRDNLEHAFKCPSPNDWKWNINAYCQRRDSNISKSWHMSSIVSILGQRRSSTQTLFQHKNNTGAINTIYWANVVLMLAHRLRLSPNTKTTLAQYIMFIGGGGGGLISLACRTVDIDQTVNKVTDTRVNMGYLPRPVCSYKLRYITGLGLVEMAPSRPIPRLRYIVTCTRTRFIYLIHLTITCWQLR